MAPKKPSRSLESLFEIAKNPSKIPNTLGREFSDRAELTLSVSSLPELGQDMYKFFSERLVGQNEAKLTISRIVSSLEGRFTRKRAGTIANLLFFGPSGVGKSTVPKMLAEFLLGDEKALTRINGGDLNSPASLTSLRGSNPQYVGEKVVPILHPDKLFSHFKKSKKLKKLHPCLDDFTDFSIISIDEIDEADPDIWDSLYELMTENEITLNKGETVNTRNIIFIGTTNLGQEEFYNFMDKSADRKSFLSDKKLAQKKMKEIGETSINKHFKSGFLSRITLVPFVELTNEEIYMALERELDYIKESYSKKGVKVLFSPICTKYIFQYYDSQTGLRPLLARIENYIIPVITSFIDSPELQIYTKLPRDTELHIDVSGNQVRGKIQVYAPLVPYIKDDFEKTITIINGYTDEQKRVIVLMGILGLFYSEGLLSKKNVKTMEEFQAEREEEEQIILSLFTDNSERIEFLFLQTKLTTHISEVLGIEQDYFRILCKDFFEGKTIHYNQDVDKQRQDLKDTFCEILLLKTLPSALEQIFNSEFNVISNIHLPVVIKIPNKKT